MKKKLLSAMISTAMLFSASGAVIPQNVLADSYLATAQQAVGTLIYPGELINFSDTATVKYQLTEDNTVSENIGSRIYFVPSTVDGLKTDNAALYCWRVVSDTLSAESGKRTEITLEPIYITYDSEKAQVSALQNTKSVDVKLMQGYMLNSSSDKISNITADSFTYTPDLQTVASAAAGDIKELALDAEITKEIPTLSLSYKQDGSENSQECGEEIYICPPTDTQSKSVQFDLAQKFQNAATPYAVSWSINDDVENADIDKNGKLTITKFSEGDVLTVTAKAGEAQISVKVHIAHTFGEWTQTLAPTLTTAGKKARTCSVCNHKEEREVSQLNDTVGPKGEIKINNDSWTELVSNIDFNRKYYKATVSITATDDSGVKDISYYVSDKALSSEELKAVTAWTSGNTFTLSVPQTAVIYAKLTDNKDNVSYISSNGFTIDTSVATGKITANGTDFSTLAQNIEFNQLTKNITFTVSADNAKSISYYVSDSALTESQLDNLTDWTQGAGATVTRDGKAVIYAKLTAHTDKSTYISSTGFVIDNTAPVISGIENGKTYYGEQKFSVTDANLAKVLINNTEATPVENVYTLSAAQTTVYVITATDKLGNTTTYNITVQPQPISTTNKILGITDGGTYKKGNTIIFSAEGDGMNNTSPKDGDVRYLPYSYTTDTTYSFTSSSYTQIISTSKMSSGSNTLSVLFKMQQYKSGTGWVDTSYTDTKSVSFILENRQEIENKRGTAMASFYKIEFDTNGGSKVNYVLVNRLKTLNPPIAPTKVGYTFAGWYTSSSLNMKYDFSQRVTKSMTLYAKWEKSSENDNPFNDVSKDAWYYDNIAYVYASGLMNGTGDAEFSPEMPTTRGMIVTILYRLEGEPKFTNSYFEDVSSDAYYYKAVLWAKANNIVNGTSATTFSPNSEITREQLMTILYRYAQFKDYDLSKMAALSGYTDADQVSYYAADAFRWAIATNLATGRTNSTLAPKASATRAEVASAFKNFIENND